MRPGNRRPLAGINVVELSGGVAGAYCGRLLADAGASVTVLTAANEAVPAGARADTETEQVYAAYLAAGKTRRVVNPLDGAAEACRQADILLVGEESTAVLPRAVPKMATVELAWFRPGGPYSSWQATDLIVQSLTAMPHLTGAVEGPPIHAGDRQSALIGGVTAYIAAVAGILAKPRANPRHFAVNILEANLVVSEMDIHFVERDRAPLQRQGINRFSPNGPVGIYPCKDGWVGITATTPDQWLSLCSALEMRELRDDVNLATRELRFKRLDEVERAMVAALAHRTPEEWSELGRTHRVPIVPVPDAKGILEHPIFDARQALASFAVGAKRYRVPRAPFGLTETPTATELDAPSPAGGSPSGSPAEPGRAGPPLNGIVVVDFAMGWAGPLASRLLADLGADVLKVEAGRYPDWWRGVNWTPEYIATRQYEDAKGFCALNRGKRGVSLDLTTPTGRELALSLIAKADAVVENQAAGVMAKLGLGYEQAAAVNPDLVMVSMSAFGTGNTWSDTRAYGSTLEQGSGLPSFMGDPGVAPTMSHLAYGDPIGGLFGCAALLTALASKARTGRGQFVNLSMIEAMLQFTTPALLEHQVTRAEPVRRGNRHAAMAPHNIYPSSGEDRWLAVAVRDTAMFGRLAHVVRRPEWLDRADLLTLAGRKAAEDEIDAAIGTWSVTLTPEIAASRLQEAGVCAAPVVHTEDLVRDPHLCETGFFIDLTRAVSGDQRQGGFAVMEDGERLGAARPAPLLGEHSWEVLHQYLGTGHERFERLVADDVVCFEPKALRRRAATVATETTS